MRTSNWVIGLFLLGMLALAGCSSDDLVACDVFAKADCLTLYDDFSSGVIDGGKWTQTVSAGGFLGGVAGELLATITTAGPAPFERARISLVDGSGVAAMSTDVRVTVVNMLGSGDFGRGRLIGFLYNTSASPPGGSQGDVLVAVNMTDTDVNYQIAQCDDSGCSANSLVQGPTSFGSVTPGSNHTIYLGYNGGTSATVQLDAEAPVTFDTSGSGAHGGPPGNPFWEVGARITPSTGLGETVDAFFDNVRTGATAP